MQSKKGMGNVVPALWALVTVTIIFVMIGVVSAIGANVTEDVRGDLTANGAGYNATMESDLAIKNLTEKQSLLATAIVFGVIILVLVGVLAYFRMR